MASVSFDGTTLASDAGGATYLLDGRMYDSVQMKFTRWQEIPVTRGNGSIMINMGTDAGYISLFFRLALASGVISDWRDSVESKYAKIGQLITPRGTFSNCLLMTPSHQHIDTILDESGTLRQRFNCALLFRRMRA